MQPRLQADIYLTGDRGAGREVRARAGQLCPPVEFGMCPPRASRRPGVKVNKGAIWTASSNPFFHPPRNRNWTLYPLATPSCGHPYHRCHMPSFLHSPAPCPDIRRSPLLCSRTKIRSRADSFWCCQQPFSIFILHKLQIPALLLAAGMHANAAIYRGKLAQWWSDFPNAWHTIKNPVVSSVSS